MGCDGILPLLKAFLDRELDPLRREAVASHLEECASCRELLREDGELSAALASGAAEVPMPRGEVVERWARAALEENRTTVRWLRRVAAAAAALLVASLVAFSSVSWHAGEEAAASSEAALVQRESALEIVLSDPSWGAGEF